MEQRRWLIFFLTSFLVIQIWVMLTAPPPRKPGSAQGPQSTTATLSATPASIAASGGEKPATATDRADAPATPVERIPRGQKTATFLTNKYRLTFDLSGGVLSSLELLDPGSDALRDAMAGTTAGIELIRRIPGVSDTILPLEITFSEDGAYDFERLNRMEWRVRSSSGDANKPSDVRVELESPPVRGIRVIKALEFGKDEWYGKVRVALVNETSSTIRISDDRQRGLTLRWGPGLLDRSPGEISSGDAYYDVVAAQFADGVRVMRPVIDRDPMEQAGLMRWAGIESKFFAALIAPEPATAGGDAPPFSLRTTVPPDFRLPPGTPGDWNPPAVLEISSARFDVPALSTTDLKFGIYAGPKKYRTLKAYGNEFERAMFAESWWWMRIIYLGLTDTLNFLYRFAGNYGVAIMLLTVLVRLIVFPLTHKSIKIQAKSMAEMSRVKPFIDEINEKYKDDPQEKSKRIWQVYQEHNINPLAGLRGCFPMLLQMPVFIGLYVVANVTIDLQGAKFLWITDLSRPDHLLFWGLNFPFLGSYLNLLPILMAVTQFIASKVSMARMTTIDPTQKQILYMMPFILGFTLYTMPAGLMVYWTTSNVWQIFQTMITNRILDLEEAKHKADVAAGKVAPAGAARGTVTVVSPEAAKAAKAKAVHSNKGRKK